MRNPKTIAGLCVLAVLLVALGILIGQMIPIAAETRREMSLTPTPEPPWPDNVMIVTPDPNAPTPNPVLRTGYKGGRDRLPEAERSRGGRHRGRGDPGGAFLRGREALCPGGRALNFSENVHILSRRY